MDGAKYRRSKVRLPTADTRFFSITTVYMESQDVFAGQYHQHPYGEINCVVQLDKEAELMGMQGWQGAGWTSPGPGTHHYPEVSFIDHWTKLCWNVADDVQVRNGALVALFFLPAGRISYEAKPDWKQPDYV